MRRLCLALMFLTLTSCVAAIGNTGYGFRTYPPATVPVLQERVSTANRIVDLRQHRLDDVRSLYAAGRVDGAVQVEAEVQLEEAKLRLIECRADLSAAEAKKKD